MSSGQEEPNHYDPFHYNPQGFNRSITFPFFHGNLSICNIDDQTPTDDHHTLQAFDPFTDLNSALDFHCFSRSGLDISCSSSEVICPVDESSNKIGAVVVDSARGASAESTPLTPNSTVSSSSNEGGAADDQDPGKNKKDKQPKNAEVAGDEKSKKPDNKAKKGKRERGPRVAFLTKSEMDHLEDGYRWRKYGQKAVKNSPYPRSYYRCTSQKCTVKKRVERSFQDPGVVITTYEGRHNHHCPANLRGHINASSSLLGSANSLPPPFPEELLAQLLPAPTNFRHHNNYQQQQLPADYGLLQDLVPSFIHKQSP